MNNWVLLAILCVLSYFFGNINFALIISKFKKSDIRKVGSGNPGTLNMSRNFGLAIGLFTFLLDIMKGAVPTLVGYLVFKNTHIEYLSNSFNFSDISMFSCGFFAVFGHIYPVFLKFKGGKGIASTIGVFIMSESLAGWPWIIIVVIAGISAIIFIYITEFGAMGSFLAITPPAISACIRFRLTYSVASEVVIYEFVADMIILLICFFTWFAHRKNIERMLAGDEHPTSIKQMLVKLKEKRKNKKNFN